MPLNFKETLCLANHEEISPWKLMVAAEVDAYWGKELKTDENSFEEVCSSVYTGIMKDEYLTPQRYCNALGRVLDKTGLSIKDYLKPDFPNKLIDEELNDMEE